MASEHSGQGGQNRLLFALTPEDHSLLAPHLKEQSLKLGTLLQEAGEPVEQIYFPHQGMVSLLAVMSDGQGIETATVGSEGVVGAFFGARRGFTRAVVQAPLVASRISSLQFQAAVQKSETFRNLMASYSEALLAQVQQTAACNALHAVESRLARWLLQTRDRIDTDVLPLTQEFLSQMLGVRRTTVTLVARQLEQAGLFKIAGAGSLLSTAKGSKTWRASVTPLSATKRTAHCPKPNILDCVGIVSGIEQTGGGRVVTKDRQIPMYGHAKTKILDSLRGPAAQG